MLLPPYPPDLNPIEQVFAKLNLLLRKAVKRSVEATWKCICQRLEAFPPQAFAIDFKSYSYASI